ncbi:hypothetical protein QJQ45_023025, partial [Haematococcus lacustris]
LGLPGSVNDTFPGLRATLQQLTMDFSFLDGVSEVSQAPPLAAKPLAPPTSRTLSNSGRNSQGGSASLQTPARSVPPAELAVVPGLQARCSVGQGPGRLAPKRHSGGQVTGSSPGAASGPFISRGSSSSATLAQQQLWLGLPTPAGTSSRITPVRIPLGMQPPMQATVLSPLGQPADLNPETADPTMRLLMPARESTAESACSAGRLPLWAEHLVVGQPPAEPGSLLGPSSDLVSVVPGAAGTGLPTRSQGATCRLQQPHEQQPLLAAEEDGEQHGATPLAMTAAPVHGAGAPAAVGARLPRPCSFTHFVDPWQDSLPNSSSAVSVTAHSSHTLHPGAGASQSPAGDASPGLHQAATSLSSPLQHRTDAVPPSTAQSLSGKLSGKMLKFIKRSLSKLGSPPQRPPRLRWSKTGPLQDSSVHGRVHSTLSVGYSETRAQQLEREPGPSPLPSAPTPPWVSFSSVNPLFQAPQASFSTACCTTASEDLTTKDVTDCSAPGTAVCRAAGSQAATPPSLHGQEAGAVEGALQSIAGSQPVRAEASGQDSSKRSAEPWPASDVKEQVGGLGQGWQEQFMLQGDAAAHCSPTTDSISRPGRGRPGARPDMPGFSLAISPSAPLYKHSGPSSQSANPLNSSSSHSRYGAILERAARFAAGEPPPASLSPNRASPDNLLQLGSLRTSSSTSSGHSARAAAGIALPPPLAGRRASASSCYAPLPARPVFMLGNAGVRGVGASADAVSCAAGGRAAGVGSLSLKRPGDSGNDGLGSAAQLPVSFRSSADSPMAHAKQLHQAGVFATVASQQSALQCHQTQQAGAGQPLPPLLTPAAPTHQQGPEAAVQGSGSVHGSRQDEMAVGGGPVLQVMDVTMMSFMSIEHKQPSNIRPACVRLTCSLSSLYRGLPQAQGTDDGTAHHVPAAAEVTPAPLTPAMLEEVELLLAMACRDFQYNTWALSRASQGHPLSTLAYFMLHQAGLIQSLELDPVRLARFLRRIEAGYQPSTPYHNAIHAADVLQTLYITLTHGGLTSWLNSLSLLACLLAAVMHDFEHGGLTNDWLIATSDVLAIRYNDRAPLENHHLAAAFTLLRCEDLNFLSHLTKPDYMQLRKMIIDLVLATDMKSHFNLVSPNSIPRMAIPLLSFCPQPSCVFSKARGVAECGASGVEVGQFNTMRRQQGAATRAASVSNGHPSSQGPCSPALASQASMPSPAASIRSQPTNVITGQAWGSAPQQGGGAAAGSPAKPGFSGLGHGPRGPRGKGEAHQVIQGRKRGAGWARAPGGGLLNSSRNTDLTCGSELSSRCSPRSGQSALLTMEPIASAGLAPQQAGPGASGSSSGWPQASPLSSCSTMPLVSMPTNLSSTSRLGAGSNLQPAALDGDEAGGDGGGGGGGREAGSSSTRALRRLEGSFSMRSTKRSTAVGAAAKAAVGEGAGGAGAAAVGGGSDGGEVKPTGKGPAGSGHSSVPHTTSVMMSIMALEQPNDPGVTAALRQVRAFQPTDDAEKLLCLQLALKASDLGHVCEGHEVHLQWVACLEEEFFKQVSAPRQQRMTGDLDLDLDLEEDLGPEGDLDPDLDREKAAGLPVSPLFDRDRPGITRSQVGFFEIVVLPLYRAFAAAFPGAFPLLHAAKDNYRCGTGGNSKSCSSSSSCSSSRRPSRSRRSSSNKSGTEHCRH